MRSASTAAPAALLAASLAGPLTCRRWTLRPMGFPLLLAADSANAPPAVRPATRANLACSSPAQPLGSQRLSRPVSTATRSPIETAILPGVQPDPRDPRALATEFRAALADGVRLRPSGEAKQDPTPAANSPLRGALSHRPLPGSNLSDRVPLRRQPEFHGRVRRTVGVLRSRRRVRTTRGSSTKDSSLVWRVATHFVRSEDDNWIGKGDTKWELIRRRRVLVQRGGDREPAFSRCRKRSTSLAGAARSHGGITTRSRSSCSAATEIASNPFAEFVTPRRRAAERYRIHGGKPIARFHSQGRSQHAALREGLRTGLPTRGWWTQSSSHSKLYGGPVTKFRSSR